MEARAAAEQMVECAAVFEEMAVFHNVRTPEENFAIARRSSLALHHMALDAYAASGADEPGAELARRFAFQRERWRGRFKILRRHDENRRWIEHCDALAVGLGLKSALKRNGH